MNITSVEQSIINQTSQKPSTIAAADLVTTNSEPQKTLSVQEIDALLNGGIAQAQDILLNAPQKNPEKEFILKSLNNLENKFELKSLPELEAVARQENKVGSALRQRLEGLAEQTDFPQHMSQVLSTIGNNPQSNQSGFIGFETVSEVVLFNLMVSAIREFSDKYSRNIYNKMITISALSIESAAQSIVAAARKDAIAAGVGLLVSAAITGAGVAVSAKGIKKQLDSIDQNVKPAIKLEKTAGQYDKAVKVLDTQGQTSIMNTQQGNIQNTPIPQAIIESHQQQLSTAARNNRELATQYRTEHDRQYSKGMDLQNKGMALSRLGDNAGHVASSLLTIDAKSTEALRMLQENASQTEEAISRHADKSIDDDVAKMDEIRKILNEFIDARISRMNAMTSKI